MYRVSAGMRAILFKQDPRPHSKHDTKYFSNEYEQEDEGTVSQQFVAVCGLEHCYIWAVCSPHQIRAALCRVRCGDLSSSTRIMLMVEINYHTYACSTTC